MDSFQVHRVEQKTGIEIGLTPSCKFIDSSKDNTLECLFVVNSKNSKFTPIRQQIEVCSLVLTNPNTNEDYVKNLRRGMKKVIKHLDKEDTFHLIKSSASKTSEEIFSNWKKSSFDKGKEALLKLDEEFVLENMKLKSNKSLTKSLEYCYSKLRKTGKEGCLKQILLFLDFNSTKQMKKKSKSDLIKLIKTNSDDGLNLSVFGTGPEFDENFCYELSFYGKGNYHYIKEYINVPKKVSKEMNGMTKFLLARHAELEIKPLNGLLVTKYKCYGKTTINGVSKLQVNNIYKNFFRKIIFEVKVKIKEVKISEFLDFVFRFIPVDSFSNKYEELTGKLRLYISKSKNDMSREKENEYFKMAKHIVTYSKTDQQIYEDILKKNIKRAEQKVLESQKSLTKFLGKDMTGHVDKIIRILFNHKDELKNFKTNDIESIKKVAKSFHFSSKIIQEDNDFGYSSGKDSDYGNWSENEEEVEEEEDDDEITYDEDIGEEIEIDDDDDEFGNIDEDEEYDETFFTESVDDECFGLSNLEPITKDQNVYVVDAVKLVEDQQKKISDVAEALNLTFGLAGTLLKHFNWNNEMLYQEFFDNKKKLCRDAKVTLSNVAYITGKELKVKEMECVICYDDYKSEEMYSLPCKHFFCKECWKKYLKVYIDDGPSCLMTPCPFKGCANVVDEELVKVLSSVKELELYNRYLIRSFVDDNPKIKWCPAPDCGKAVFCPETVQDNVLCSCGQKFCFKCQREAHEPCNCKALTEWKVKEKDESETANWLTVNTKICPKCRKCIEKNGGCNHMTCSQCKYEFCWVCTDPWSEHGSKTGGFYNCNKYTSEEVKGKQNQGKIDEARASLEKYMHYFKRYANHLNSQKFETELKKKSEEKMKKLQLRHKYSSWSDVEYIQKAIDELIECRRTLKYTYIHGYFLNDGAEKTLFEFLQEDLERETERLSGLLEAEIEKFDRDQIIASSKSAQTRLHHLLSGCKSGLIIKN